MTAGSQALNSTPVTIYDPTVDGMAETFTVVCDAASTTAAKINVVGLHAAGEFFPVPPGYAIPFRRGTRTADGLGKITAKSDTSATIYCGVTALF
jgi:hypothetical protein